MPKETPPKHTFKISPLPCSKSMPPFDFLFEWDNGKEETFIVVSLHGAKKLAEQFKALGFKELEGSISFKEEPPKTPAI